MTSDKRPLFVTAWLPTESNWTLTAGIARRQRILVDGLKASGTPIDVLLMLSPRQFDGSDAARQRIATALRALWGDDTGIALCAWQLPPPRRSIWRHQIVPAFDFHQQREFEKFSQSAVVDALNDSLARKPPVALFQGLRCIMPALRTGMDNLPPTFLDMDDVEHVSFRRRVTEPPMWPTKYLDFLQIPALMYAERRAVDLTRKTFVCSTLDQAKLVRLCGRGRVDVLPNAVATRLASPPSNNLTLLMLGHYSFLPNRLGAEYFLKNVWPGIRKKVPAAKLVVAGADPRHIEQFALPPEGVTFPGYVDDLDPLYAATRAVICPILSGGGTRLKILEAASYGRPVVSTTIGAEGIELQHGSEVLLADTPQALVDACVKLLDDPALAARLGAAARAKVDALYGRSQVVARLAGLIRAEVSRHAG